MGQDGTHRGDAQPRIDGFGGSASTTTFARNCSSRHLPGVSVAVVKDGRLVKAAGYGLASLELDAPATEKTVYEIGSISKQFAANAVLLLVEEGKLRLDDPISKFLTSSPACVVGNHRASCPDAHRGACRL